jgi:hypothetical protein
LRPTGKPYLSFVATSRNDDHGGEMLRRMQLFVNGLVAQCDRHRLDAELVLVEWNPPPDRPSLSSALAWPESRGYCTVRIVQVPPDLHATFAHSDQLGLFQMIAKNTGIRRARGPFVLATNVDVLLSDPLMAFLARRRLNSETVYRANRLDVEDGVDPEWPLDRQLAYCRSHVTLVNEKNGSRDLRTGAYHRIYPPRPPLDRLPVRVRRQVRMVMFGWWTFYRAAYWFVAGFNDPRAVPARARRRLGMFTEATRELGPEPAGIVLGFGLRLRAFTRAALEALRGDWEIEEAGFRPHSNASGDFTLMSKEAWFRTRGYAELEMYSMHIDGLLLHEAHWLGLKELDLELPIYHVEHEAGFKPRTTAGPHLFDRLDAAEVPRISDDQLHEWTRTMQRSRSPMVWNAEDWGLAGAELPEVEAELQPRIAL